MPGLELENQWLDPLVLIVLWTVVFTLVDLLSPLLLSNVVASGFAGGVSFALSLVFLQRRQY